MTTKIFRFRSSNGNIYSNSPEATEPRLTISRARILLNELYEIAIMHDPESVKMVCNKNNV